jgi:WD40 repeat protein
VSVGLTRCVYTFVSHNGRYAIGFSSSPTLVDLREKRVVAALKGLQRNHAAFSRDSRRVMGVDAQGHVVVWDTRTGNEVLRYSGADNVAGIGFSPGGRWLAVATTGRSIHLVDARKGRLVRQVKVPEEAPGMSYYTVAFDRYGRRLIVIDSSLKVWVIGNAR